MQNEFMLSQPNGLLTVQFGIKIMQNENNANAGVSLDRPYKTVPLTSDILYHLFSAAEVANVADADACRLRCLVGLGDDCGFSVHDGTGQKCQYGKTPVGGSPHSGAGLSALPGGTELLLDLGDYKDTRETFSCNRANVFFDNYSS